MEGDNQSPSTSKGATVKELKAPHIQDHAKSVKNAGTGRVKPKVGQPKQPPKKKPQTARDRARLDAGRQALRELLKERKQKKSKRTSCASLIRLYLTIIAALLIIGGMIVLLFLVPMTIDPALATINYAIDVEPAICLTRSTVTATRSKQGFWCSCTEGCTKDIFFCQQITVAYRKRFLSLDKKLQGNFNATAYFLQKGMEKPNFVDDIDEDKLTLPANTDCNDRKWIYNSDCWDYLNASLNVNVKGCGYPPYVNCSNFIESYNKRGRRFLCYYSKLDPSIVIIDYDPNKPWNDIVQSLGWTFGAQVVGAFLIFVLHCPYEMTCKACKSLLKKSNTTK